TTSSGTKSNSAALAFRGTLSGAVSAAGKPTLAFKGRAVTTITAGKYTLAVTDSSKKAGFIIQGSKTAAVTITTAPFTGTKSVTITLSPGQSFFYPSIIGTKSYFIVVAATS